jgi:MoxR-like ATPase
VITERDLDQAHALLNRLRGAIHEVIVGQKAVVDATLIALLCRGNLLLEGVPGLGKTILVLESAINQRPGLPRRRT